MAESDVTILPLFYLYEKPYMNDGVNIENYRDAVIHIANKGADIALEH